MKFGKTFMSELCTDKYILLQFVKFLGFSVTIDVLIVYTPHTDKWRQRVLVRSEDEGRSNWQSVGIPAYLLYVEKVYHLTLFDTNDSRSHFDGYCLGYFIKAVSYNSHI